MKDEPYKCVITPNVRTIKMRSLPVEIRQGLHVIDDQRKNPHTITFVVPAGTEVIQSYHIDADGKRVVTQTMIAGYGVIDGDLPETQ